MKVRHTYRLRPGKDAQAWLAGEWGRARAVWNHMVAESRRRHQSKAAFVAAGVDTTYLDERRRVRCRFEFGPGQADRYLTFLRGVLRDPHTRVRWLAQGSSVIQQQIVRDFAAARAKALADIKDQVPVSQRRGLPRFKSRHTALPSMNLTRRGFTLRQHPTTGRLALLLPGGVIIPVVWSRELPSKPKSVRIYQDSLGHWYASFVVEATYQDVEPAQTHTAIGVDWGVSEAATTAQVDTTTGDMDTGADYDLPHAQHGKVLSPEVARWQRTMARRRRPRGQPASHGYRKARWKAAQAQKKAAHKRKDEARKWAKRVAADHHQIAVEDFRPRFLASTTMARKAADAAIAETKTELLWQARKAGRDIRLVHPANTTTDCYNCDARTKHRLPLGQRTYTCTACGWVRPRDKNSAAVMVARAGFDPADAEGRRPGKAATLTRAA